MCLQAVNMNELQYNECYVALEKLNYGQRDFPCDASVETASITQDETSNKNSVACLFKDPNGN